MAINRAKLADTFALLSAIGGVISFGASVLGAFGPAPDWRVALGGGVAMNVFCWLSVGGAHFIRGNS